MKDKLSWTSGNASFYVFLSVKVEVLQCTLAVLVQSICIPNKKPGECIWYTWTWTKAFNKGMQFVKL